MMLEGHVSLSIKQKILRDGKEGCVGIVRVGITDEQEADRSALIS